MKSGVVAMQACVLAPWLVPWRVLRTSVMLIRDVTLGLFLQSVGEGSEFLKKAFK